MDEAARAELDKIEASRTFAASHRLRRFLRFTVEAKLSGQEGQIKEYVIGREVYDRGENYDTRSDPIVRVEARRLRAKLEKYYKTEGLTDPIRIEFPTGTYVPVIRSVQETRSKWYRLWAIAAVVLVMLALGTGHHILHPAEEMIAVAPARWLLQASGDIDHVDENLAAAITSELAQRRTARVIAWPPMIRHRAERKEVRELAAELGAAKVLMVSVRAEQGVTRVTVYLVDPVSDEKMLVADFSRNGLGAAEAQREVARLVADEFEAKKCKTPQCPYRISMA